MMRTARLVLLVAVVVLPVVFEVRVIHFPLMWAVLLAGGQLVFWVWRAIAMRRDVRTELNLGPSNEPVNDPREPFV